MLFKNGLIAPATKNIIPPRMNGVNFEAIPAAMVEIPISTSINGMGASPWAEQMIHVSAIASRNTMNSDSPKREFVLCFFLFFLVNS